MAFRTLTGREVLFLGGSCYYQLSNGEPTGADSQNLLWKKQVGPQRSVCRNLVLFFRFCGDIFIWFVRTNKAMDCFLSVMSTVDVDS